jgi:hypothetical protein
VARDWDGGTIPRAGKVIDYLFNPFALPGDALESSISTETRKSEFIGSPFSQID